MTKLSGKNETQIRQGTAHKPTSSEPCSFCRNEHTIFNFVWKVHALRQCARIISISQVRMHNRSLLVVMLPDIESTCFYFFTVPPGKGGVTDGTLWVCQTHFISWISWRDTYYLRKCVLESFDFSVQHEMTNSNSIWSSLSVTASTTMLRWVYGHCP